MFIARNCEPARQKGEVDLVGAGLCRSARPHLGERRPALPELIISREKHEVLVRTAHAFLRERHVKKCPVRFDVVAIGNMRGKPPVVRLHKDALSPKHSPMPSCLPTRQEGLQ